MTEETQITCPYCGEEIIIVVDCSEDHQVYTEDCSVCCKPILVSTSCTDGELKTVRAKREN